MSTVAQHPYLTAAIIGAIIFGIGFVAGLLSAPEDWLDHDGY